MLFLPLLALMLLQDDIPRQARALVETLGADRVEDRDEAARALQRLGRGAVPEVEKATRSSDGEVARRAQSILRAIAVRERLTQRLVDTLPGIVDRLAAGENHAWMLEFGKALVEGGLEDEDLDALVASALAGARTREEKLTICETIWGSSSRYLPSAAPGLTLLIDDERLSTQAMGALISMAAPEAVPGMEKLLTHARSQVRVRAANLLGRIGSVSAIPALSVGIRDSDEQVRQETAFSLAALGSRSGSAVLGELLKSTHGPYRERAVRSLGNLGATEWAPEIRKRLDDTDQGVQLAAVKALGRLGAREAVADLVAQLSTPSLIPAAAESLVQLEAVQAIPLLIRLVKSDRAGPDVVRALGRLEAREAAPELIRVLGSGDERMRLATIRALVEVGVVEAVPELVRKATDSENRLLDACCSALAALDPRAAIPPFLQLLDADDERTRQNAALALGTLGAREASPRILKLYLESRSARRWAYSVALAHLGAQEAIPGLLRQFEREPGCRPDLIVTLGQLGAREAAPAALKMLREKSSRRDVACSAWTLAYLGASEAIPDLLKELERAEAWEAGGTVEALGWLGAREAVPAIRRFLKRGNSFAQREAATALSRIGAREARVEILRMLQDSKPAEEILGALERLEAVDILPTVGMYLADDRSDYRIPAARFVCRMGSLKGVELLLRESPDLTALNALRQPETWKRLGRSVVEGPLTGSTKEVVERIARAAGLAVQWPEGADGLWTRDHVIVSALERRPSARDALETALDGRLAVVLEGDRIVIHTKRAVRRFWSEWWAQAGKPK